MVKADAARYCILSSNDFAKQFWVSYCALHNKFAANFFDEGSNRLWCAAIKKGFQFTLEPQTPICPNEAKAARKNLELSCEV